MKRSTLSSLSALAILIAVLYVPAAIAQPSPEMTTWTINEPTQVGDVVLQPGTYRLKVTPTPTTRSLVRVMSEDGQTLYTTAVTVPHKMEENEELTANATFIYYPAVEGQPRALRTWFAPSTSTGHDFVYEEDMAARLARANQAPVVSYRGEVAEADLGTTELHVVTPEARVETYTTTPALTESTTTTIRTEEQPVAVAEARTDMDRTELPATAGNTPLLALLGFASYVGAFAIRFVNR